MADALCGPSNALQTFQKHTSTDKTLQQDRLATRQNPAEAFRSAPGPNAGILDAEFEAFQAGHPLQNGYPESGLLFDSARLSPFSPMIQQPEPPNWASDFQNLQLNDARASPIPQSHFHQHAPMQRSTPWGWHMDFQHQQGSDSTRNLQRNTQQQQSLDNNMHRGWSHGYTGGLMPQQDDVLSSRAQQKQPERHAVDVFDEAAFEQAFEAARSDVQQSEELFHQQDTQLVQHIYIDPEDAAMLWESVDQKRIGSDRILEEAQDREQDRPEIDDGDELARTAGQLLENVKGDQSQKFQESNFLSLMRQLRDREVRVEGDKIVDATQALHPGGENYPNEGGIEFGSATSLPVWPSKDRIWDIGHGHDQIDQIIE
ncbi:hypothetical protein MMC28_007303 [Mycoblastus sanguinarius]|nr:hypothetical protein [Mycoblastus sanguinarius]